uniref:Uncharacterized protein n=1 Tax=Candidatus Kentrum sp. SD TaxID=2126332 RepID=A0A450Y9H4_9GAMM|nr:MAG: hypothetical protein BECKSD772F_GA0070984_102211 [Candidatus Kentron sp. SD]VFK42987.1 MAG: hypothetical protein BECKSD772E_GA0070983_102111 [Candidatus Kentron sp. SD]
MLVSEIFGLRRAGHRNKKSAIAKWKRLAVVDVEKTESLKERADSFVAYGVNLFISRSALQMDLVLRAVY